MFTGILTPGQSDLIGGTYGPDFANRYVVSMSVRAPTRMSKDRISEAMRFTEQSHPALRAALTDLQSVQKCRQVISPYEDDNNHFSLSEVDIGDVDLQRCMDNSVATMASGFDLLQGKTWGITHLRADHSDHLVFAFNHAFCDFVSAAQFVSTFIRSYVRGARAPGMRDSYMEYLEQLERSWESSGDPAVDWWQSRPWKNVTELVSQNDAAPVSGAPFYRDVVMDSKNTGEQGISDIHIIRALEEVLREVTTSSVIRLDVAVHGRDNRVRRAAGGWVAHALPFILDRRPGQDSLSATREMASAWPAAFAKVRARSDIPQKQQIGGHAFVNFLGSFDPRRWSLEGYTASEVQPRYEAPGRISSTPIQLRIRKNAEGWLFSWSFASSFGQSAIPVNIISKVHERLSENANKISAYV